MITAARGPRSFIDTNRLPLLNSTELVFTACSACQWYSRLAIVVTERATSTGHAHHLGM